jgi:DNA-3-methyladenine glycosylase II
MDIKIINQSIIHLMKDKKLKSLIDYYSKPKFINNSNYFDALSKSIIYQQLSGKVAKIIYTRFLFLFKNRVSNPIEYLSINNDDLRGVGLSKQKISYIENLSNYFINSEESLDLTTLSNEDVINELIIIKGIGRWTIDMFLMFTLFRTDILPVGDLGIKKSFKQLYDLKELPDEKYMINQSKEWSPYRTIACCYLWMIIDNGDVW